MATDGHDSPTDAAPNSPRTDVLCFDLEGKTVRRIEPERIEEELKAPERFVWVDVQDPDPRSFLALASRLEADLGSLEELGRPEILPRLIERTDFVSFQLYEASEPERSGEGPRGVAELEVCKLVLAQGKRFALTYHAGPMKAVAAVKAEAPSSFRLWGKTPGFLTFLLMERCLFDYALLNLVNDNSLDPLEETVLGADHRRVVEDIAVLGRNILLLKKLGASLQIVLMSLATRRSLFVSEEAREFYREMFQNAASVRAAIDSSRDLLDGVVSSLHAQAANRTAEVARTLTIVSTVILPLTLITGIYGMNFKRMPELEVPWAYFAVLGAMAATALVLLTVFWRRGWLNPELGALPRQEPPTS